MEPTVGEYWCLESDMAGIEVIHHEIIQYKFMSLDRTTDIEIGSTVTLCATYKELK